MVGALKRQASEGRYFSDVAIEANLVLTEVPIPLTTVTITMLIPVAIKQYSMAVVPDRRPGILKTAAAFKTPFWPCRILRSIMVPRQIQISSVAGKLTNTLKDGLSKSGTIHASLATHSIRPCRALGHDEPNWGCLSTDSPGARSPRAAPLQDSRPRRAVPIGNHDLGQGALKRERVMWFEWSQPAALPNDQPTRPVHS